MNGIRSFTIFINCRGKIRITKSLFTHLCRRVFCLYSLLRYFLSSDIPSITMNCPTLLTNVNLYWKNWRLKGNSLWLMATKTFGLWNRKALLEEEVRQIDCKHLIIYPPHVFMWVSFNLNEPEYRDNIEMNNTKRNLDKVVGSPVSKPSDVNVDEMMRLKATLISLHPHWP